MFVLQGQKTVCLLCYEAVSVNKCTVYVGILTPNMSKLASQDKQRMKKKEIAGGSKSFSDLPF